MKCANESVSSNGSDELLRTTVGIYAGHPSSAASIE